MFFTKFSNILIHEYLLTKKVYHSPEVSFRSKNISPSSFYNDSIYEDNNIDSVIAICGSDFFFDGLLKHENVLSYKVLSFFSSDIFDKDSRYFYFNNQEKLSILDIKLRYFDKKNYLRTLDSFNEMNEIYDVEPNFEVEFF